MTSSVDRETSKGSILTTILQEVTQGNFDSILRVKEEYDNAWWFHIDLFHEELIRQKHRFDLMQRLFVFIKHQEYKIILRSILQANQLRLLAYWHDDAYQLPYLTENYHYIYILFESLRLQHTSGIKLAQKKLDWRPAMKAVVYVKIVRILFHENDPELVVVFMNYVKKSLNNDVYISIRGEILEYQVWNEDSVHQKPNTNLKAFQETFLRHQGFVDLIRQFKQEQETYQIFILDAMYSYQQEQNYLESCYLILDALLYNKVLPDIIK